MLSHQASGRTETEHDDAVERKESREVGRVATLEFKGSDVARSTPCEFIEIYSAPAVHQPLVAEHPNSAAVRLTRCASSRRAVRSPFSCVIVFHFASQQQLPVLASGSDTRA